jgi:type I restriction enzyme R subunit
VFKKALDELGAPPCEVIISGSHNDDAYLTPYTDPTRQKNIIKNFTKPLDEDPTALLIVKDMLLTGFDAPIAQVMYIDRSLKDHTLMQAIARVNRTYKGKQAGFIVDYYGLSDHLTQALDLFSSDDVEGSYVTLRDELPKLKAAHTRVADVFKTVKGQDIDNYVLHLKDEETRQQFDQAFKRFAKQLDVILPDATAQPFLADLRLWGKVQHAARNRYHDAGLNLHDAGAKVRKLVDEHIISTGVDPKIPPVDLMDANFKTAVEQIKSPESRASEIESAIKHHITVNLDEDPEYYRSLSLRLRDIIEKTNGKWEQQLELLLHMVGTIESDHRKAADDLGLNPTEYAFYNILMVEVTKLAGDETVSDAVHDEIKTTTQALVAVFEEATQIVDFFSKPDEIKRLKKEIKRAVLDCSFNDKDLVTVVQDRFMELAKTKFGQ